MGNKVSWVGVHQVDTPRSTTVHTYVFLYSFLELPRQAVERNYGEDVDSLTHFLQPLRASHSLASLHLAFINSPSTLAELL